MIQEVLKADVLGSLRKRQTDIARCRAEAMKPVWWPGLSLQLSRVVEDCTVSTKFREQNAEPLLPASIPSLPWQLVGVDLCNIRDED